MVTINSVSDDTVRLRLFQFYLRDRARSWFQSLPFWSFTIWADMATKLFAKYFPPAKSAQLKIKINTFRYDEFSSYTKLENAIKNYSGDA